MKQCLKSHKARQNIFPGAGNISMLSIVQRWTDVMTLKRMSRVSQMVWTLKNPHSSMELIVTQRFPYDWQFQRGKIHNKRIWKYEPK